MANAMRFTTVELSELERKIARPPSAPWPWSSKLFDDLVAKATARAEEIALAARALAETGRRPRAWPSWPRSGAGPGPWSRTTAFAVEGGRHPVVEAALEAAGDPFVANDCDVWTGASGSGW